MPGCGGKSPMGRVSVHSPSSTEGASRTYRWATARTKSSSRNAGLLWRASGKYEERSSKRSTPDADSAGLEPQAVWVIARGKAPKQSEGKGRGTNSWAATATKAASRRRQEPALTARQPRCGALRARWEINASDGAGFLFVRQARKGAALPGVCNPFRNAADGQKDTQEDAFISHRAVSARRLRPHLGWAGASAAQAAQ